MPRKKIPWGDLVVGQAYEVRQGTGAIYAKGKLLSKGESRATILDDLMHFETIILRSPEMGFYIPRSSSDLIVRTNYVKMVLDLAQLELSRQVTGSTSLDAELPF